MHLAIALTFLCAAASAPSDAAAPLARGVHKAFQAAGKAAPVRDPALDRAALALARRALVQGATQGADNAAVAEAISAAGAWDPDPRALAVRSGPARKALQSLQERQDLAAQPATHFGAGFVEEGGLGCAVLLLTERRVELQPFPRQVSIGDSGTLEGKLAFPLYDARLAVTGPRGVLRAGPGTGESRDRFSFEIPFELRGRYSVEVLADSIKGPQVVALFQVQSGAPLASAPAAAVVPETQDLAKAEDQVLAALNASRKARGLKPLARSSLLDSVAAEHAQEMARLNYFAHVSPKGGDPGQRLSRAGFRYRRVTENLGEDKSALAAHRNMEASPGHLANLLDSGVDLAGLGTAKVTRGNTESVILVELFARAAEGP